MEADAPQTPDDGQLTVQENIAACEQAFVSMNDWNERFDAKVATVLTLATAMLGAIGALAASMELAQLCGPVSLLALSSAALPLLLVVLEVSRGTTPTMLPPSARLPHQPKKSLLFFGSVAACTKHEFNDAVLSRSRDEYLADLIAQQHTLAAILARKFRHLAGAYRYLWISYATFVPACTVLMVIQTQDCKGDQCASASGSVVLPWVLGRLTAS